MNGTVPPSAGWAIKCLCGEGACVRSRRVQSMGASTSWHKIQYRPSGGGKEEDSSSHLISARCCGLAAAMTLLQCLYGALLGVCDRWIRLCEYKPPLCFSALYERSNGGELRLERLRQEVRWCGLQSKSRICWGRGPHTVARCQNKIVSHIAIVIGTATS